MRVWFLVLLAACGSGVSSDPGADTMPGSFDDEEPAFRMTLCKLEAQCSGKDEAECLRDVADDMQYVKDTFDDALETRCAACMHARTVEYQKVLDASCDFAAGDEAAILAACDLDPNDGMKKADEACGGYP